MVEHPDELAGRKLERRVRRRGDPGVGRAQSDSDPRIPCWESAQVLVQLGRRGAVVDDHELPVLVRLGQHGCDGGLEDVERRLVRRHQDRDERPVREELGAPDVADPCRPQLGLVDDRLVPELGRQGRFAGERQQEDSRRLLRRIRDLVPPTERREASSEPAGAARGRDGALISALRHSQRGRQPPRCRRVRRLELSTQAVAGAFELRASSLRLPHRPLEQLRVRTGLRRLAAEPRHLGAGLRDRRLQLPDELVAPRDLAPDAGQFLAIGGVQIRQMLPVEQNARPERRQLCVRGERDQVDRTDRLGRRLEAVPVQPVEVGRCLLRSTSWDDRRAGARGLAPEPDVREMAREQVEELELVHLAQVIGVGRLAGKIGVAIGRGEQQDAVGPEDADELPEQAVVVAQMLERLEADDRVHGRGRDRERRCVGPGERDLLGRVVSRGMGDRLRGRVDADDGSGDGSEQPRAVALAAGHVEHVLALAEPEREEIAMEVLVLDLVADLGRAALPGGGQRLRQERELVNGPPGLPGAHAAGQGNGRSVSTGSPAQAAFEEQRREEITQRRIALERHVPAVGGGEDPRQVAVQLPLLVEPALGRQTSDSAHVPAVLEWVACLGKPFPVSSLPVEDGARTEGDVQAANLFDRNGRPFKAIDRVVARTYRQPCARAADPLRRVRQLHVANRCRFDQIRVSRRPDRLCDMAVDLKQRVG